MANVGLGRHEHEQDDGAEPRVRDDAAIALLPGAGAQHGAGEAEWQQQDVIQAIEQCQVIPAAASSRSELHLENAVVQGPGAISGGYVLAGWIRMPKVNPVSW